MKLHIFKIAIFFLALGVFASCDSNPVVDFGEQYKKTIYIVNSRGMLYSQEHFYDNEEGVIEISVYCGSSEPIKKDINVTLKINPEALDSLNKLNSLGDPLYVNKTILPESHYDFSKGTVTIKAKTQYTPLQIPIITKGLDADITYTLPISIVSNDANYDINPELKTIIYELRMVNGYSGSFSGSSTELPKTIRSVQPTLKAISSNTVRMPIHNLSSNIQNLDTNFMLLTIGSDSTSVSISPWKNAKVTDLGGSTFDKKRRNYTLNYSFENKDGVALSILEKISDINYTDPDEEEEIDE